MIKQTLFTASLALLMAAAVPATSLAAPTTAAAKTKTQQTWLQKALAAKDKMAADSPNGLPFVSPEYRRGTAPGNVSIDLTGLQEISLVTWATPDGTDYDHAVWANARFTKKDGTVVWLEDMKPKVKRIESNWTSVNQNFAGNKLQIRDTKYDHGIIAHANSLLTYDLNGEYTRFDADFGIDEGSSGGSAVFKVMVTNGRKEADALVAAVPEVQTILGTFIGAPISDWLTSPGTTLERAAATKVVSQLDKPDYFNRQIDQLEANPNVEQRILGYMELTKQAEQVLNLQTQLAWLNVPAIGKALADMKTMEGFDGAKYDALYAELQQLTAAGFDKIYAGDKTAMDNATKALALKRQILMANPLLDMDKIVVTKYDIGRSARYVMAPALGTQPNNWSNQYSASRGGFRASIVELSNLRGDKLKERIIYKPKGDEPVTDVHMHWNADRMLFTSVDSARRWHVFEVNTDGTGLKNITAAIPEPDVEFADGAYLPDGRLIINTTLGYHGVPCVDGVDAVGNFALYDPKTGYLRRLTFDQDNNWNPTVMNNGRVMYTRWEYTDLIHYFSRFVMHMNPDGTENKNLYGSGSYFPNSTFDMQPLPDGSSAFVGIISGHHGIARSGRLIIFDPAKSRKEEKGMVQEIPFSTRPIEPIIKDELVNGVWPQFIKPQPLSNKYFLVTAKLTPNSLWGIYLVDIYDNMTLVVEGEGDGYINAIPVMKKTIPPIIPDKVNEESKEATVFIQDIYEGEGLPGVPRGTVKKLRILAYEYAYRDSPSNHAAQGIQSGWDIKRLLGEVPVEPDGSAIFTIPANTPISLQPLDSLGRAIQWMRSWFVGMPGETVSCVGCHEDQNLMPIPKRTIASTKKPSKIEVPEGGVRPFTFELEIQPILDRACVACHNNEKAAGGKNFTGGRYNNLYKFSDSYLEFHPYFYRQGPEADMYVLVPYEFNASNSELIQMLENGHHGVKLTDKEWKTLYNWIDFNTPYHSGFFNIRDLKVGQHGYDQVQRRKELAAKYANGMSVDWQQEIRDYAAYLEKQPKTEPVMPEEQPEPKVKTIKVKGWPFSAEEAQTMVGTDNRKTVEIAPGVTMNFVRIPAGTFVMGADQGVAAPKTKVKIDKPFWMGELEVSNEQFRALFPNHDNRLIGQHWKDHTGPNYLVNEDWRPTIRVSWQEAMEYCRLLSEKTGLKITLPTEAQWEWAARAGSDGDNWWGVDTDFSPYENLADVQLQKMAVSGVDPQPMSPNNPIFKYWDFLPKDSTVDDGNMLLGKSGSYRPNAWGLYDMQGNVAEWTRSDYRPYPYSAKADATNVSNADKVARGGSWIDRTKNANLSVRRHFLPWQKVRNVGFRVIIEE